MRNLILILIAFLAMVTFIRAFDKPEAGNIPQQAAIDINVNINQ